MCALTVPVMAPTRQRQAEFVRAGLGEGSETSAAIMPPHPYSWMRLPSTSQRRSALARASRSTAVRTWVLGGTGRDAVPIGKPTGSR
jgi:hypothetical protein